MKEFLDSQPQIKHIVKDGVPTPQLHMYRAGEEKSAETLFATYVPVSMVKDILEEKSLLNAGYADL